MLNPDPLIADCGTVTVNVVPLLAPVAYRTDKSWQSGFGDPAPGAVIVNADDVAALW